MKLQVCVNGIILHRDVEDKAISHESTVTHHLRRLLNQRDGGGWTRCYPDTMGLTGCRQGVQNRRKGIIYWHERYAIEAAHQRFNRECGVFYQAA